MAKKVSPEAGSSGARDRALRLLSRRAHGRTELARKLVQRGCAPEDVAPALEALEQSGYLNDAEVAVRWVEVLVHRRCWGPQKIAAYLAGRGIDREIAERAQRDVWEQCREEDIARRALRRRFAGSAGPPAASRVVAFLRSRGFSAEVLYAVVRDMSGDAGE